MIRTLLGGLSAQEFLSDYWQKKPLLVRNAIPDFRGPVSPAQVKSLACDENIESRLVWQENGSWQMAQGPLRKRDFPKQGPWTALVQGLNLVSDEADKLLRLFSFIPYARLDDLMVSYATDGGGVGPHFDSYDVFLLQGEGQRRWQISSQRDLSLVEDAPLKILKNFKPAKEWVLNTGDMLYLPPRYSHNGVAIGECTTYSIGFRAPSAQEMAVEFLSFLQESIQIPGMYTDPHLQETRTPAEIQTDMIEQVAGIISKLSWRETDVATFLGRYLSEPKPHVFFDPPDTPLTAGEFRRQAKRHGLQLDLRTQMLYRRHLLFLNGETYGYPGANSGRDAKMLRELADQRRLTNPGELSDEAWEMIFEWYCDGFIGLVRTG